MRGRLLAAALAAAAIVMPATTGCGTTAQRSPILFVHGFGEDPLLWSTMIGRLRHDGWSSSQLVNWTYDSYQPNAVTARQVKAQVEAILRRTHARRVDLVSHAMGSLSTRWYIKALGGAAKVHDWVSLGGPNHGSSMFATCLIPSCLDLQRGARFLARLNAGDETPGSVHYLTVRSSCDDYVVPSDSVELTGATNLDAGCVENFALTANARVYARVREFVR